VHNPSALRMGELPHVSNMRFAPEASVPTAIPSPDGSPARYGETEGLRWGGGSAEEAAPWPGLPPGWTSGRGASGRQTGVGGHGWTTSARSRKSHYLHAEGSVPR